MYANITTNQSICFEFDRLMIFLALCCGAAPCWCPVRSTVDIERAGQWPAKDGTGADGAEGSLLPVAQPLGLSSVQRNAGQSISPTLARTTRGA